MDPLTQQQLIPAKTEVGDYRVVNHFASGGMGDVYRVLNPLLQEFFAMKVLREEATQGAAREEAITRFFQEARITVRLRHSNIVTLHTMGFEPTRGRLYFIMDYIGVTPARRREILANQPWFSRQSTENAPSAVRVPLTLEEVLKAQGKIPENIVRILAADIARALHSAHTFGEGIIHCDLKPSNILLRNDGHAVVSDFGISKSRLAVEPAATDAILGTPDYMAPEQRLPNAELTPATDIYAYGVMLHKLLTGQLPIGARTSLAAAGFNPVWDKILERCLERQPQRRWGSMVEIIRLLHAMPVEGRRILRRQRTLQVLTRMGKAVGYAALVGLGFSVAHLFSDSKNDWYTPQPNPKFFRDGDLSAGRVWGWPETVRDVLTYDESAPRQLPDLPCTLHRITQLALPASTEALPSNLVQKLPNLAYIACHSENRIFFSRDGILYRRDTPSKPFLVPSRHRTP